jgi:hypothetical protein
LLATLPPLACLRRKEYLLTSKETLKALICAYRGLRYFDLPPAMQRHKLCMSGSASVSPTLRVVHLPGLVIRQLKRQFCFPFR